VKQQDRAPHGRMDNGFAEIRPGLDGGLPIDRLCVVLASNGCDWYRRSGGCLMCNFPHKAPTVPMARDILSYSLLSSFRTQVALFPPRQPTICIYNSGSFFSDSEVPPEVRHTILAEAASRPNVRRIVVESRCDHLTEAKLEAALKATGGLVRLSVGMGLETASNEVRNKILLKGFSNVTFLRAASLLHGRAGLVIYILVGAPFLTEAQRVADAKASIAFAQTVDAEEIYLQACNVQPNTVIHTLWEAGQFRPPWLWTVRTVLEAGLQDGCAVPLFVFGREGTPRPVAVASNCDCCTRAAWDALDRFNSTQQIADLTFPDCDCRKTWTRAVSYQIPEDMNRSGIERSRYRGGNVGMA
jgi:hypothetical protein